MFSREEVISHVRKTYNDDICLDFIDDAMNTDSLDEAAEIIIVDSELWNRGPLVG